MRPLKVIFFIFLVLITSAGCVQPTINSRSGQENFNRCVATTDHLIPSTQKSFWVKINSQEVWMSRRQAINQYCLENQAKIEKKKVRITAEILESQRRVQEEKYKSIRDFHKQCENFSTDIIGRWQAGCPLSPQEKVELRNRGYNF